jgi:hypothetical protein
MTQMLRAGRYSTVVSRPPILNLSHATVHEQLYASDVGAVVGAGKTAAPPSSSAVPIRPSGTEAMAESFYSSVINAPLNVIGTGSYLPELCSET